MRTLSTVAALAVSMLATGCMTPPSDLDLALDKKSAAGTYQVALMPPAQAPAINQLHSWRVRLASPAGVPIAHARIRVDGGMPQHGHGLPTRPQVTETSPDGSYLIEGMKFSMTGWWEIKLAIDSPEGADRVTFNTLVAEPAASR